MSIEIINKAREIVQSVEIPERHSYFQIEKFMIGNQPTGQAQLWQIVREVKSRVENIESIERQIEDMQDTIEEVAVKISLKELEMEKLKDSIIDPINYQIDPTDGASNETELLIKGMTIEVRKLNRLRQSSADSVKKLEKKIKYIIEEVDCLAKAYDKIVSVVGPVQSWDDPQAQREMWGEKFLEEFNLRVILNRPLDTEFVKSILSLDDDALVKQHITSLITKIQHKMLADSKRAEMANTTLKPQAKIQR
jgi:hypothetical protein